MTIRRKITNAFLVFPIIVFVAGGILSVEEIRDDLWNANQTATRVVDVIAHSLVHKLERSKPAMSLRSAATIEFVQNMKIEHGYDLIVVDSTGMIIASGDDADLGTRYRFFNAPELKSALIDGKPGVFVERHIAGDIRRAVERIRSVNGSLNGALLFDYTSIYDVTKTEILEKNLVVTGTVVLTIIFSLILGRRVSTRLTKPILELSEAVGKVALGNLDVSVHSANGDEIGLLSKAFSRMTSDIKESRRQLENQLVELQESETRFKIATSVTRDSIWHIDWKTRYVTVSESYWTRFGYSPKEVRPTMEFWAEKVYPEEREAVVNSIREAVARKSSEWEAEYRLRRADGSYAHVLDRCSIEFDDSNEPLRLVGALTDISERVRAQKLLAEREESFRLLFTNNPHPMWVYDRETYRFLEVNDAAIDGYGFTRSEFLQMRILDIRPQEEVQRVMEYFSGERPPLQRHSGEWKHRRKNGTIFDVDIYSHQIEFLGKHAALVIAEDITKRKETERKLQQSEVRFRSLIERSSDVVSVLDPLGTIRFISPSVSQILGYDPSSLMFKNSAELVHPDDRPMMLKKLGEVLENPGVPHTLELRFRHSDGSYRYSESVAINALHVPEVAGIIVNNRDVTEKKKLEAQFLRAQRLESIGTLAGGIAHDLNNILAPILLSIDMIRELLPEGSGRKMVDTLEISARRGADLVRQVLSFARGVEGDRTLVQLKHLIREIERIISETFPRNISTATEVSKNLWPVTGDATQLHQIMMNLCVNSRDAMPTGGRIEISADNVVLDKEFVRVHPDAKEGPYVLLTVSDNGTGIPPGLLDRIFEPFFTTKDAGKGTGLGLSTVLTIVKSHGGLVSVYSEEGKGTSFKIYLPAQATSVINQAEKVDPNENLNGSGELVLVVDDEAAIREFTKGALEAYGYKTISASDGTEALVQLAGNKQKIDLVITDMMMPYLEGAATIRAMRVVNPTMKIIAVSGLSTNENAAELAGVVAFLHKPYTTRKLLRAVRDALNTK